MHFEILVEDSSGKEALNILLPKILNNEHTFKIHSYKGVGHIPKSLKIADAKTTALLNKLPRLVSGYAKSFKNYPAVLFIICDLDNKNLKKFNHELTTLVNKYKGQLNTEICFAIEEGEAWLLGDISAIKQAYPNANDSILCSYKNDAICGTWETLANAIYDGGAGKLKTKGYQEIGTMKSEWAKKICQFMDINNNQSPSFNYFLKKLTQYIN
ncbi:MULTISPECIES: DUF4276 family protein [Rodentibacter]|uniref:DUF4276 family protein n=1 Tax=Rodentibacter TaxID=1960084 RepID=UPI001CFCC81D|nr:DUF4276 family protein [Rodentibacter sp. JRC1]GJI55768.1 hypothetical protein HEMROJRC1_08800 [Rodentibacter sp. JRC1]